MTRTEYATRGFLAGFLIWWRGLDRASKGVGIAMYGIFGLVIPAVAVFMLDAAAGAAVSVGWAVFYFIVDLISYRSARNGRIEEMGHNEWFRRLSVELRGGGQ